MSPILFAAGLRHVLPLLLALACVSICVSSAPAANNPLPNPGFENVDAHWRIADSASKITTDAARTGKMGLHAGQDLTLSGGASISSSWFPVKPGQKLSVDFWARTQTKNTGVYLMFFRDNRRMVTKPVVRVVDQPDGQWHPYTLQAEAPEEAAFVTIWIHTWSGSSGAADLDDFVISGVTDDAKPMDPPAPRPATKPAIELKPEDVPHRKQPAVIILKLDDLKQVNGTVYSNWTRVTDYLAEKNIKASIGIICQTLERATPTYCQWIKSRHETGMIEFWFHGWDHGVHEEDGKKYNEFSGRPAEQQKQRLDRSQQLAKEKLGFYFETFGPPGGVYAASYDNNTLQVMAGDPHIHIMLYPEPINDAGRKIQASGKLTILDRVWAVNLEGKVGQPDFQRFLRGYAANLDRPYFVLQGHAAAWNSPQRFDEFKRIIEFLVERKAVFMTPAEYVALQQNHAGAAAVDH